MKSIVVIFLAISLIMFSVVGCSSKNTDSKILGQWKIVELNSLETGLSMPNNPTVGKIGIEFFSDKTYNMPWVPDSGTWTILEDGRIKLQQPLGGKIMFASLQGDTIVLEIRYLQVKITCKKINIK